MWPILANIAYVIDENLLAVGRAMVGLRRDTACFGQDPVADLVYPGILDPIWIPMVGERGWTVITSDKRLRTRPGEAALAIQNRLKVIHLYGAGNLTPWAQAVRLLSRWEGVERHIAEVPNGPWWLSVRADGLRIQSFAPGHAERI